ncbi:MAG: hypothetical protein RIR33_3180 [Pseudomonadota bacterium]|jgi:hypothetical protein
MKWKGGPAAGPDSLRDLAARASIRCWAFSGLGRMARTLIPPKRPCRKSTASPETTSTNGSPIAGFTLAAALRLNGDDVLADQALESLMRPIPTFASDGRRS